MVYNKQNSNIYIGNLFPKRSYIATTEDRIKKYLKEEDYDWAKAFCISVESRDDKEKLKSILMKIKMESLVKCHEEIQLLLDNNCSVDELKAYLETTANLISTARKIANNTIVKYISEIPTDLPDKDMLNAYDNLFNALKEEDNGILASAKNAYTEEYIAMLGTKISCFQSLISKETNNLLVYMLDALKTRYKILVSKVASNTDKEMKSYISGAYTNHIKSLRR